VAPQGQSLNSNSVGRSGGNSVKELKIEHETKPVESRDIQELRLDGYVDANT
jgi:hypothetical protein